MIDILNIHQSTPYKAFIKSYKKALKNHQKSIEAICISSFDNHSNEVNSRYVNLKYIKGTEWIFFSNYNSKKSQEFLKHDQISALIFWESINLQIRIKANIKKTDTKFSDEHFSRRSREKNSIAISSNQSSKINSFEENFENYYRVYESTEELRRPNYWGGFSFTPYYFEFWEGHEFRLNKREVYEKINDSWNYYILQP